MGLPLKTGLPDPTAPTEAAWAARVQALQAQVVALQAENQAMRQAQAHTHRHFSRELHDRTSPNLAALRINLASLSRASPQTWTTQAYAHQLEDTQALLDDTTHSIRELCADLYPPALTPDGLLHMVQRYLPRFTQRTGLAVQVTCAHGNLRLAPALETALFRLLQEALANCAKHANACNVYIRLQLDTQPRQVAVQDDGCGFDPSAVVQGQGLRHMREATEAWGGQFSLQALTGQGTCILVTF
jgi:signal transduction histidine kinase